MVRSSRMLLRNVLNKKIHGTDIYFKMKSLKCDRVYHYRGKIFSNNRIIKVAQIKIREYNVIN
jgi:hypothetical protein